VTGTTQPSALPIGADKARVLVKEEADYGGKLLAGEWEAFFWTGTHGEGGTVTRR